MQNLEDWIKENFTGLGAAVRRETDPPLPGEPYMPMTDAKDLVRKAVAHFGGNAAGKSDQTWRDVPVTTEFLADLFDAYCGADGHNLVVSVAAGRIGQHIS